MVRHTKTAPATTAMIAQAPPAPQPDREWIAFQGVAFVLLAVLIIGGVAGFLQSRVWDKATRRRKAGRVVFWIAWALWAAAWQMLALTQLPNGDAMGALGFMFYGGIAAIFTLAWIVRKIQWAGAQDRAQAAASR